MRTKLKLVEASETDFQKVADHLWVRRSTGRYYVRKTFRRYRIPDLFQSTEQTKIGKAKSVAAKLIADHMAKYLGNNPSDPLAGRKGKSFAAVADEILACVTPLKRARTQRNHKYYLRELKKELGSWDVDKITLSVWNQCLAKLRAKNPKRASYRDFKKHLNLVIRYAYDQRYTGHLQRFPNPDVSGKKVGRVYTDDEIARLWEVMSEDTKDQFVLSYECFMRIGEVLHLSWDRVDLVEKTITLTDEDVKTGSSTGKGRTFVMSDEAYTRLLRRYEQKRSPYVFPNPRDKSKPANENKEAWATAKMNAKIIGRARWHDLRHTALSKALLVERIDVALVSEYAGVSIATLQKVYLHSTAKQTESVSRAIRIQKSVQSVCTPKHNAEANKTRGRK